MKNMAAIGVVPTQRLVALLVLLLLGTACRIPEGQEVRLGIPYRAQDDFNHCVPASILMWRLYDGLPAVSQASIFAFLGGAPCTLDEVPAGVNHFTRTDDTFADIIRPVTEQRLQQILARQITSVGENRTPVIALVRDAQNHVGVVSGGSYHRDPQTGLFIWDSILFHDPSPAVGRGHLPFTPAMWLDFFCDIRFNTLCGQVVSTSAILGWDQFLLNFGGDVRYQGQPGILNQQPLTEGEQGGEPVKLPPLSLAVALLASPVAAEPWVPISCEERHEELQQLEREPGKAPREQRWREYEAAVRQAKPGSTEYAPHPFPTRYTEIVENTDYAIRTHRIQRTPRNQLAPDLRAYLRATTAGTLAAQVVRVENWNLSRCSTLRPVPYYHLVRLYDSARREFSRVAMHHTGLWGQSAYSDTELTAEEQARFDLLPLQDLQEHLRTALGVTLTPTRAQYVAIEGGPGCYLPTSPCVAFQVAGESYVLFDKRLLYRIDFDQQKSVLARRQEQEAAARRGELPLIGAQDYETPWLTIGFGWARAQRIAGEP